MKLPIFVCAATYQACFPRYRKIVVKSHSGSRESIDKGNSKFCWVHPKPPAIVSFRDCITIVLKPVGFKTWFPFNRAAPSHQIASGGSGTPDTRFYLSMIKRLCHSPQPACTLRFHNCIMIMSKPWLSQFRPRLGNHHYP